jgi:hypothetical protein
MHDPTPKRSYRKLRMRLSDEDRNLVQKLLRKGHESARVLKRVAILSLLDKGERVSRISVLLDVSPTTVRSIGWRYIEGGLAEAIYDRWG